MNNAFDYAVLGQRIRKTRKSLGITQEQLAEKCNLSTAHIGHIERGTRALSIESLIVLSQTLNISTDYLLLDISSSPDNRLAGIFNAVSNADEPQLEKFYSVIKILAENIDKL